MLLVGIDVSKSKHHCYIVDSEGTVYENNLQISNNIQGFKTLSQSINSICQTQSLKNVKIGLESTGHYSTSMISINCRFCSGFNQLPLSSPSKPICRFFLIF